MDKEESIDIAELLYGIVKEEVDKLNEVKPQDTPAVCEYSGLRPVEGYKEMSDKELKEGVYKSIIDELDNREGETPEEKAYRMGWINGYEEGVYDGENK